MSRPNITTAISWLLVIFLLGLMIMIDGNDMSWLETGTRGVKPPPAVEPAVETTVNATVPNCEETEDALRDRVDSARSCATDDDCTLFDFGYPIDCMTSVAKTEITDLRHKYRRYEQSCAFRVYFDCPAEPMERRAACRDNRCVVTLETVDGLKDETLDFLGIESSGQ